MLVMYLELRQVLYGMVQAKLLWVVELDVL
jgi:hypothetical protein